MYALKFADYALLIWKIKNFNLFMSFSSFSIAVERAYVNLCSVDGVTCETSTMARTNPYNTLFNMWVLMEWGRESTPKCIYT